LLAAFVVICVVAIFIRAEIYLILVSWFSPGSTMDLITRYQRTVSRRLFILAQMIGGMRAEFAHYPGSLPRVFMIVSNHQSLVDIPALALAFPRSTVRYVSKKELGRGVPMVSRMLRVGQSALISRTSDYRRGHAELRRFAALTRQGYCPVVFPEGTRSRTGRVRDFQAGAVRIILEEEPMPVLSVAVDGGYSISKVWRLLANLRGARYRVKPLTLYPAPRGKKATVELLEKMRLEISAQVDAWRAEDARRKKTHP
jgi:1-acyl-sn-glycerol-3-phosphate acyltransferase